MTSFQRALASPFEETPLNFTRVYVGEKWSRDQLWNCTHFRHPTDDQLHPSDINIFVLATINCI